MIGLHRDPRGTTLFKGHAIKSSSTDFPSQGNSLRKCYMKQIENLRRRVKELESLINQSGSTTESSRDTKVRVDSVNPCYMDEVGDRGDELTQCEHSSEEEPVIDDVESTERVSAPPREGQSCTGGCLEQGAESNEAATEIELSKDNVISDISHDTICEKSCSTGMPQAH